MAYKSCGIRIQILDIGATNIFVVRLVSSMIVLLETLIIFLHTFFVFGCYGRLELIHSGILVLVVYVNYVINHCILKIQ